MIRAANTLDATAITEIYNRYIRDTVITFEEEEVSTSEMARRIETVTAEFPWLVYETGGKIAGYAYAKSWHLRSAYRHSVEASVYLGAKYAGRGIGQQLYAELIARVRALDIHCIIGGIALPNPASVALHEKLGFEKAAHYKEVGRKFDRWIDVGYWQLLL